MDSLAILEVDKNKRLENKKQMISAAYLKVLMNFFQIMGIITLIKINFNSSFYTFATSQKIFSGFFFNVVSLDCILDGYYFQYFIKINK